MGLVLCGACAWATAFTGTVTATTGAHPLAQPPRYKVSRHEVAPYLGRFRLAKPLGRRLISGAYVAVNDEFGYPKGTLVVYTYDGAGRETSWIGTTYEYHETGNVMTIDVISPENQVIFARLRLRRLPHGKLTGVLFQLIPPGRTEQVTFVPVAKAARGEATGGPRSGEPAQAGPKQRAAGAATNAGVFSAVALAATRLARTP